MLAIIKNFYFKHNEIINNFIWRSLQILGRQGASFLVFIFVAKRLETYQFGVYIYLISLIFFLILFGDFGISTATSKYVVEYNIKNKEKLKSVLFNTLTIVFLISLIVSILVILLGRFYLKDNYYYYVIYLLPLLFLVPATSIYDGIYRGLKKFKKLSKISLTTGIISLLFAYGLVLIYKFEGALVSQSMIYIILLIGLAIGYRDIKIKFDMKVMKEITKYSLVIGFATLGYYLFSRVVILILGHYQYLEVIAVYGLLTKILGTLLIPFIIVSNIIAPNFSGYFAKKRYSVVLNKYLKYVILSFLSAIIFFIIIYFSVPVIIEIFFSGFYNEIFSNIFIPVIITYFVMSYSIIINTGIIVSTGYARIMTYSNIIIGILNLILSLILLNITGYIGVIYSVLILNLFAVIIYHYLYYLKIKKLAYILD